MRSVKSKPSVGISVQDGFNNDGVWNNTAYSFDRTWIRHVSRIISPHQNPLGSTSTYKVVQGRVRMEDRIEPTLLEVFSRRVVKMNARFWAHRVAMIPAADLIRDKTTPMGKPNSKRRVPGKYAPEDHARDGNRSLNKIAYEVAKVVTIKSFATSNIVRAGVNLDRNPELGHFGEERLERRIIQILAVDVRADLNTDEAQIVRCPPQFRESQFGSLKWNDRKAEEAIGVTSDRPCHPIIHGLTDV